MYLNFKTKLKTNETAKQKTNKAFSFKIICLVDRSFNLTAQLIGLNCT